LKSVVDNATGRVGPLGGVARMAGAGWTRHRAIHRSGTRNCRCRTCRSRSAWTGCGLGDAAS